MRKIIFFLLISITVFGVYSCVKDRNSINTDFSSLKPFLELKAPDFPNAGAPNFAGIDHFANADIGGLTGGNDTVLFYVNLASINKFNTPINVTVGVDEDLIKAFNDTSQLEYKALPGYAYKQLDKSVVIPPNERIAQVRVVFKTDLFSQLDPTVNYMLPITILKGDGIEVSANEGTVWFHTTGNCIAGLYDSEGTAYSYLGSGADTVLTGTIPIFFTPKPMDVINSATSAIDYGNQGPAGWRYLITFDCGADTILNVAPNDVMYANIRINSFKLEQPATYDPVKRQIHLVTSYLNSSGNLRKTDEILTEQ